MTEAARRAAAPAAVGGRARLWAGFLLAHVWLAWLGVVVVPSAAFHDVDLYRWWSYLALEQGTWPVLHEPWVYPAGALLPVLAPTLATGGAAASSTVAYAVGWCVLVTALDVVALRLLLARMPGAVRGGWWWTAFLVLLGPVAMGRLDGVVAPLVLSALVLAGSRPAVASALLTLGAWVKVAPGALLLPLVAAARRPWRTVVAPAAAVCAVVVGAVGLGAAATGGTVAHLASFLTTQGGRGLQVESVGATGWVLASLQRDDVVVALDEELVTYQVHGPGTQAAADVLDVLLPVGVAVLAVLLLVARRRGAAVTALVPGAFALTAVLVVANKVGSPQLLAWFAGPAVLTVAARGLWAAAGPALLLVAAAATQLVFPWGYLALLGGDPTLVAVLTVRNVLLVGVLVTAVVDLVRVVRRADPGVERSGPPDPGVERSGDDTPVAATGTLHTGGEPSTSAPERSAPPSGDGA
ncbi:hypothetical protein [Cellulomonas sp. APG4]|uniref:hypothetical protein n=1 Tax=Cellulomonas sp. APG4 TaxID=1538656 RepID=UPI00351ACA81